MYLNIRSLDFSYDGKYIACSTNYNKIFVYIVDTLEQVQEIDTEYRSIMVSFSPSNYWIAICFDYSRSITLMPLDL